MADELPLKPVIWVGASLKHLREFPAPVQDHIGYALYVAQPRRQASGREGAQRLWRSRRSGNDQRLSR